ncbi:dihydrofolate reductase family protein [Actinosynnema pretiosum subsp. pretiosum]|uniref:Bifunctional deaminase-reductase domain protein n=2 Tax=Actinosynnema TaxID=40566 RepID=C6W8L7_ACTMD|nr:dihydrofolate reductase family protein [Actinosynnema mirum]ACU37116.1 bifunctional deaminase-reductase domain protein [Actinosynnema mirum DSM 43827]AQZ37125.1 dihydrofolate reductase [Actinosynnema pretiosum subsp. pretiosum]AXX30604.1 Dihydrofolate reductase [Actinosynnema pretiosum subsp. pretiosum]QUF05266.1 dihydrofolate reductase family protein [Actinosynnema pretiosum subsp. pretiosum]
MRKLVYFIAASIDGVIAGPEGEYDFYPTAEPMVEHLRAEYPETTPTHVRPLVGMPLDTPNKRYDTVLMGRGSYQPALDAGVTSPYAHLRQHVVSRSLPETADPAVTLVRADPVGLVRDLKREDGLDVWLCGGADLAGQLLPEIDELVVKTYPVVAGGGTPLFRAGFAPRAFTPVDVRAFDHGGVVTTYRPA